MKRLFFVFTLVSVFISLTLLSGFNGYAEDNGTDWAAKLEELRAEIAANGYTYTVDYNPACQYTLEQLCGFNPALVDNAYVKIGDTHILTLPSSYMGYHTPPKDQGSCGSCWAFAMVGAVEGLLKMIFGTDEDLSEQQLLDCNPWGYDCDGGWFNYGMFIDPGAETEACYPYVGFQTPCDESCPNLYFIYDWAFVPGFPTPSIDDIKVAIMMYGSVSAAVYASPAFHGYSGGVFNNCTTGPINHGIVLCGWDDTLGAWRLKNSWTTGWGEGGYMWITYGCNQVGYGACYPIPFSGG
ncbi:MAG: hypothetical protein JSV88_20525 [Candidatus Aminicenantes bacterium]|nr:MAG: hypothetical protein JSV88_20525 [Candidatus Aminicenantes bacterium]